MKLSDVWPLVNKTYNQWSEHDAASLGAALSYYTVLSLAPLIVVAIGIAGLVFGKEAASGELVNQIQGLIGRQGAQAIQAIVKNAKSPAAGVIAEMLGVVTLLFGASGVFSALRNALDRIWDIQEDKDIKLWARIREQLLSFGMVLGIGFLLLVSLILSAALSAVSKFASSLVPVPLLFLFNLLVSLVVITLLFAMIYRFLPKTEIPWHDVWWGAIVTAVLFTIGKALIGLYLGTASVGSAYGAAGSLIILLVWVYYSAQIFLFGAEFTHVYAHQHGSRKNTAAAAGTAQDPAKQAAKEEAGRRLAAETAALTDNATAVNLGGAKPVQKD